MLLFSSVFAPLPESRLASAAFANVNEHPLRTFQCLEKALTLEDHTKSFRVLVKVRFCKHGVQLSIHLAIAGGVCFAGILKAAAVRPDDQ